MRGAHHGFELSASLVMEPPKLGSGAGNCLPSIVVVAPGEPSTPVTCCAYTVPAAKATVAAAVANEIHLEKFIIAPIA